MIYSKNFRWGIGVDKFGPNAHKASNVYKIGIHCWIEKDYGEFHCTIVYSKTKCFRFHFPYKGSRGECGQ